VPLPPTKPVTTVSIPHQVPVTSNALVPFDDWEIIRMEDVPPAIPDISPSLPTNDVALNIPEYHPEEVIVEQEKPISETESEDWRISESERPSRRESGDFGWARDRDPAWGLVDKAKLPPVDDMIAKWQEPPKSDVGVSEQPILENDGSVAAEVSRRNSAHFSVAPTDSVVSVSGQSNPSEYRMAERISKFEIERMRSVAEIQKDLLNKDTANDERGNNVKDIPVEHIRPIAEIQKELQTKKASGHIGNILVPGPRPASNRDVGNKRHGKVLSLDEMKILAEMRSQHDQSLESKVHSADLSKHHSFDFQERLSAWLLIF
jgi:hypothetical protein